MITEILRPRTVQEALKAKGTPGAVFLGGGTSLNRAASPDPVTLISLERLGLASIEAAGERCIIGAAAVLQQLVDDAGVPGVVRRAARLTASRTLRNMITIGGEIAVHAPDSALVPVLLALGAELTIAGKKKPLPVETYLQGGDGLILSISIPGPSRPGALQSVSRTSHGGRSLVLAACADEAAPRLKGLRIVASDCRGNTARLKQLEEALEGRPVPAREEIERAARGAFSAQPDIHASASYKDYMLGVLAADALGEMA